MTVTSAKWEPASWPFQQKSKIIGSEWLDLKHPWMNLCGQGNGGSQSVMCSIQNPGLESVSLDANKLGVEEKWILKWKWECYHRKEEWMPRRKNNKQLFQCVKWNPCRADRQNGSTSKANSNWLSVVLWNARLRNSLRLSQGKTECHDGLEISAMCSENSWVPDICSYLFRH